MNVRISEIINENFRDFWYAAKKDLFLHYVLKGGRGSAKSTHVALFLILAAMQKPITILCIRKVGNTLSESVYEQLKEAIEILKVGHLWKIGKSPLQLTYKPRGNKIIFRGADDAAKIKSIKMSEYPIAYVWFEELAEFKTEDDVTTIVNSILRKTLPDGMKYKVIYSYNPPKRKQSWVNKKFETQFVASNTFIHHSTYLQNKYISDEFKEDAENIKIKNEFKYKWEYLGMPLGSGIVPFTNLKFEQITDEQIKQFDNIKQGLDFGYATDPVAFVRMHYDKTRRKLYIFDEYYGVKKSNRELAEYINKKRYGHDIIIADSAEPKSIDELKTFNIRIKGAKKGAGSVEYGEKWLDDLDEIIIDSNRCPNTAREFENIDYQTDKDGNVKPKLDDKDNHTIDAVRYGCEDDMKNKNWLI